MQVLLQLVHRPGDVVAREQLLDSVWDGLSVGDEVLSVAVAELRKAFGDDAKSPGYIQTFPGKGYSLIATVSRNATRGVRPVIGIALALAALAVVFWLWPSSETIPDATSIRSVVALPATVQAGEEDAFLAEAFPNTLSTYLAQVDGLQTRASPRKAELERLDGDLDRVAAAYDVDAFVLSSVVVEGERLVLNVRLVGAGDRRVLWGRDFDGRRGGYIDLVREAADGVRRALRSGSTTLGPAKTESSEAELQFQRGRYHQQLYNHHHREPDFQLAKSAFERALSLDTTLVDAAAGLGWLYEFRFEAGERGQETLDKIDHWIERTLSIDPNNGLAWTLYAFRKRLEFGRNHRATIEATLKGAHFAPDEALSVQMLGQTLDSAVIAAEAYMESSRRDPLYLYGATNAANRLGTLGRHAEALTILDEVLALEPDFYYALRGKSVALHGLGRLPEAERLLQQPGVRGPFADLVVVFWKDDREGVKKALTRIRDQLHDLENPTPPAMRRTLADLALFLAVGGRPQEALALLVESTDAGFHLPYDVLRLNPHLESLQGDPQFEKVASGARANFDAMLEILEEARERGEFPVFLEPTVEKLRDDLEIR